MIDAGCAIGIGCGTRRWRCPASPYKTVAKVSIAVNGLTACAIRHIEGDDLCYNDVEVNNPGLSDGSGVNGVPRLTWGGEFIAS